MAKVRVKPFPDGGTEGVRGFYGERRRYVGDVFDLEERTTTRTVGGKKTEVTVSVEDQFSDEWMEWVEKPTPAKRGPGRPPKSDKAADSAE